MRHLFLALLLACCLCAVSAPALQAQTPTSSPEYNSQFYLFTSIGRLSGAQVGPAIEVRPYRSLQLGASADRFLLKGLAVGGEIAKSPTQIRSEPVTFTYRAFGGGQETATRTATEVKGYASVNLSYHFKEATANRKLVPFVTGGVTIFVRDGLMEAFNYGGGVSLWRSRHHGWRVEYRKFHVSDSGYETRMRSLRFGLVLR